MEKVEWMSSVRELRIEMLSLMMSTLMVIVETKRLKTSGRFVPRRGRRDTRAE